MIKVEQRLEFENVFDEEPKKIKYYLEKISWDTLINIIGFSNTIPQPNYYNFATNPVLRKEITAKVENYLRKNRILTEPIFISREGSLRLAEIILENQENFKKKEIESNIDSDELNLFKAYLIINKKINKREKLFSADDNIERMSDILISLSFQNSDIGLYDNTNLEFAKLLYASITRFEMLLEFLSSETDYEYLLTDLLKYFDQTDKGELLKQVKYLFGKLLIIKFENGFKFQVDDKDALQFLNTLISEEITEDEDFTYLKNHPLYKIDDGIFSLIDYFFVLDKFYKSIRFVLKASYHNYHNLPDKDRSFFTFYNTEFSENFLMKNLLDKIFHKPYFVKKEEVVENQKNEPDYYVRHNNRIYLFENKDVLIAKKIKNSGNIDEINKVLKSKFLEVNNKHIGIGQLITSIEQIISNNFVFDDYVNHKRNLTIYPILLVSDRIFEIPGMNFKLNNWYLESIKNRLGNNYNPDFIKNLTLIDIDTIIYWLPDLKKADHNFKKILEEHHTKMKKNPKVNNPNPLIAEELINRQLTEKLSPISNRFNNYNFPIEELTEKFEDVISD